MATITRRTSNPQTRQPARQEVIFNGIKHVIGRKYKYADIDALAKHLKITSTQLIEHMANPIIILYDETINDPTRHNQIIHLDLREPHKDNKALLKRFFNVKQITNKQLLTMNKEIIRYRDIENDPMEIMYNTRIRRTIPTYNIDGRDANFRVSITGILQIPISDTYIDYKFNMVDMVNNDTDINDNIQTYILGYWVGQRHIYETIQSMILNGLLTATDTRDGVFYVNATNTAFRTFNYTIRAVGGINNSTRNLTYLNGELHDITAPSINNIYKNVLINKTGECIYNYIKKLKFINKDLYDDIKQLKNANDIKAFSIKNDYNTYIYNIEGQLLDMHTTTNNNNFINYIIYEKHLYPIKGIAPIKQPYKTNYNIVYVNNINEYINNEFYNGIIVSNIYINNNKIYSCINDNIKYLENPAHRQIIDILTTIIKGLYPNNKEINELINTFIFDNITIKEIGSILTNILLKLENLNYNSFIPNPKRFNKCGIQYMNKDIISDNTENLDFNKHYLTCLYNLEYIITFDIRDNTESDNLLLDNDTYLYIVKPLYYTLLIPNTNIYTGAHLIYARGEGVEFNILKKYKTYNYKNIYNIVIDELKKHLNNDELKFTINKLIGCFETSGDRTTHIIDSIISNNELEQHPRNNTQYQQQISDNLTALYKAKTEYKALNKKCISIQIKDEANKKVYLLLKSLNIDDTNLININVDAITYNKKDVNINNSIYNITKEAGGIKKVIYKDDKFNKLKNTTEYYNLIDTNNIIDATTNNNILYLCYAGTGKTTLIINEIIPLYTNYIVITPTHATTLIYKTKNLNVDIIQYYTLQDRQIKDNIDTIIIDEIGLFNNAELLQIYKWFLSGYLIVGLGDIEQLKPVGRNSKISNLYLDTIFTIKRKLTVNYRNNFTIEYYDKLINMTDNNNIKKVIKYYNSNDSNNIICYKNATCDKHNKLISEKLGYKERYNIGATVIITSNKLMKYGLYNKMLLKVINNVNDIIEFNNGVKIDIEMFKMKENKQYIINWGYAKTLYYWQGLDCEAFNFDLDDAEFLGGDGVYTLISRLKGNFKMLKI